MKKKLTILLAFTLILSFGFSANLNTSYAAKDLSDIKKDIQKKNAQLKKGQEKARQLSSEIQDMETKISIAEKKIADLETQIQDTKNKIETVRKELKKAEKKVQKQSESLDARLRTMYKNGSIGFLDILLGSGNLSEFINNLDLIKKVHANDKDVLASLEKQHALIKEKKDELLALKKQLGAAKEEQAEKKKELAQNKKLLADKRAKVVASNNVLQDNIADLKAEADRIQKIIDDNKKKSGGGGGGRTGSGKFTWPVPGYTRISSDYGWRNCPFHGYEKHTGIDIPAAYGASVVAADSGTVIFSGYLGSYGNAIIISHGNNLYTLYGHNSSLVVSSGGVSKGQTIAKIGSTGSSTGPHCHFEVRKGGNYGSDVNPWNYL